MKENAKGWSDRDRFAPIGVFDSGMGGLSVLAALLRRLRGERFVYLSDSQAKARNPTNTAKLAIQSSNKAINFSGLTASNSTCPNPSQFAVRLSVSFAGAGGNPHSITCCSIRAIRRISTP